MHDVMLDLETMGTSNTAAIVAIGAVEFDPNGEPGSFVSKFYVTIDLQSNLDCGMTVDGLTVQWWLGQSDEARSALTFEQNLASALYSFQEWFGAPSRQVWGNGASFDCVILASAYRKFNVPVPWSFYHERCYRTMKEVHNTVPRIEPVVKHNALHDAVAQAHHLQLIYASMR
jgi:DNA polymerase III epsilon subunit-like protein